MSFFCGGTQMSSFGGGPYRAIKEKYLTGASTSNLFRGVVTSISQLYDFSMTELSEDVGGLGVLTQFWSHEAGAEKP